MNRLEWKEWWRNERLNNKEIWKTVEWYEWLYKVSNKWNVYSHISNKILKNSNNIWYSRISIIGKDGSKKSVHIHRLVAIAFIEKIQWKEIINHINWIKTDNRVENLEWCTIKENIQHSWRNGMSKTSINNHFINNPPNKWKYWINSTSSKQVNQYTKDGVFIKEWGSMADVQRKLSINRKYISMCCRWKIKTSWWFIWKFKI